MPDVLTKGRRGQQATSGIPKLNKPVGGDDQVAQCLVLFC